MKKITINLIIIFLIIMNFKVYSGDFLAKSTGIYFKLYQNYVSPIRANYSQCGFYPSCSQYARQALLKYGFYKGLMMTGDRLMRCHHDLSWSRYWGQKNSRIFDPPQFELEIKSNITFEISDIDKILQEVQPLIFSYPWIKEVIYAREFEFAIFILKEIYYAGNPESSELSMINYLLGWLNEQIDQNDVAISYYKKVVFSSNISPIIRSSFKRVAEIYLNTPNLYQLQIFVDQVINSNEILARRELISWKYMCYIGSKDFTNASEFVNNHKYFSLSEEIKKIVAKFKKGPPGSPLIVGVCGTILPGSGYLISGESYDALAAFLTNLLLIGGTIELIQNKSYLGATFLGMFTLPFYLGNIYGGINTMRLKQANWRQHKLFELKILLKL